MTKSLITSALPPVLFLSGAVAVVANLSYIGARNSLITNVALSAILATGLFLYKWQNRQMPPVILPPLVQQPPTDPKTEIPHRLDLCFSNIVLHPLSCTTSTLGKVAALIVSAVFTFFSFGLIRYLFTEEVPLIIQTQDSQKVHLYPGDLTPREKSTWRVIKSTDKKTLQIHSLKHPGYQFTIRDQDLFLSGAQVIVNAANSHLGGGGGIDGAIHAKGGTAYAKAHKALKKTYGGDDSKDACYPLGYAAMINSGNLRRSGIDNVIVVAGPQNKATPEKENQLYSAYYNSLELAYIQGKTSIAFPAISTGIFNFPKERAAAISLRAVADFMNKFPQANFTISIHAFQSQRNQSSDLCYYEQAL